MSPKAWKECLDSAVPSIMLYGGMQGASTAAEEILHLKRNQCTHTNEDEDCATPLQRGRMPACPHDRWCSRCRKRRMQTGWKLPSSWAIGWVCQCADIDGEPHARPSNSLGWFNAAALLWMMKAYIWERKTFCKMFKREKVAWKTKKYSLTVFNFMVLLLGDVW